MKYELESGAHAFYRLAYHMVWCVKYRRQVLSDEISDRLKQMLTDLVAEADCKLIVAETELDHVHLVLRVKPTHQLSKLVNSFKGVTARRLFQEFPTLKRRLWKGHLWSPSYFLVTVGGAPLDELQKYVGSQRAR